MTFESTARNNARCVSTLPLFFGALISTARYSTVPAPSGALIRAADGGRRRHGAGRDEVNSDGSCVVLRNKTHSHATGPWEFRYF